jgi:hypothetical protein
LQVTTQQLKKTINQFNFLISLNLIALQFLNLKCEKDKSAGVSRKYRQPDGIARKEFNWNIASHQITI